jgi:hypothetical protein
MRHASNPHPPGSAEETTEERERRMAERQVGPEDETRSVPDRPDPEAVPPDVGSDSPGVPGEKPPGGA